MDEIIFRLMKLKAKGFCCAQILLILALEEQGKSNADLVRSMGGLCFGIHGNGEVCGALTGGACLLSLYAGKGSEEEEAYDRYGAMAADLTDWFQAAAGVYGGTRCDDILEKSPNFSMCGQIVTDAYEKCMEILSSNGFDPATGKRGRRANP